MGLLFFSALAMGTADSSMASSRATKKLGLFVGIVSEPFPSVFGFNAAYNIHPRIRLGAGYGSISATSAAYTVDITTLEASAKFFILDWNFAPFVGGGLSSISGTISGTGKTSGLSLTQTGLFPNIGFGIDWQTYLGFNLGFDYKMLFANGTTQGLPGFYLGWYF